MDWRHDLLTLAEAYCGARKLSESRVATLVGGTGIFFRRIRNGGDCSATVYQRALGWFDAHWPADTVWPEGVERRAAPVVLPTAERAPLEPKVAA